MTVRQSPLPVILLFVVFVGLCDGVAQGAIFGDVALLPPKYTQVAHMAANAICILTAADGLPNAMHLMLTLIRCSHPAFACTNRQSLVAQCRQHLLVQGLQRIHSHAGKQV